MEFPVVPSKLCRWCRYTMERKLGVAEEEVGWRFLWGRFWHALRKLCGKECQ